MERQAPNYNPSITEANYALTHLSARGIGLYSNHEALYLGSSTFAPFFTHLNTLQTTKSIPIFVHPTTPCLHSPNTNDTSVLINANPTLYNAGIVEFYFETARTFMDLTLMQTLVNSTKLKWVVPHGGGAFPSIIDRFFGFTNQTEEFQARNRAVFETRVWWDVAGPVFPRQVRGLLGYGVPVEQLVYGSVCFVPWESEVVSGASFMLTCLL